MTDTLILYILLVVFSVTLIGFLGMVVVLNMVMRDLYKKVSKRRRK
jgi:hypothetical protein